MTTRKDIEQVLWNACDSFRGKLIAHAIRIIYFPCCL